MAIPTRILQYGMSSSVGGIETFIMNVYRRIDKKKFQFDFLAFGNQIAYAKEIQELGGKVYYLKPRKESFIENYKQINTFFKEHQEYTNIHFHLNTCSYIKPLISAAKTGERNIIAHSHNQWNGTNFRIRLFHNLNKPKVVKLSNHLIACSDVAGKYMFSNNSKICAEYKVINNAIDAEVYRYDPLVRKEIRSELNLEKKFVVGHVGRFSYQKNHEFILDVFKQIYIKEPNAVLLLIGNGELEEKIKSKIKELNLEKAVRLLGVRDDIQNLLQAMDVFLFPSHFEGLPFTLIEAQASGLPCIISDTISNQVKITDCIKYKSLNDSPEEWANYVMKYKGVFTRKDTYEEIVKSGFEITSLVSELEKLYV